MAESRIAVVADPYTAQLFRMTGLLVYEATSREEALKALEDLERTPDVKLVLIAAELYDQVSDAVDALRRRRRDVVVSRLPTLRSPGRPMDVQRELLRALGMG